MLSYIKRRSSIQLFRLCLRLHSVVHVGAHHEILDISLDRKIGTRQVLSVLLRKYLGSKVAGWAKVHIFFISKKRSNLSQLFISHVFPPYQKKGPSTNPREYFHKML